MKAMIPRAAALLAALLLTACGTPAFRQPEIDLPVAFKEAQATPGDIWIAADGSRWTRAHPAEQQPRGEWWLAFNDPALTALIGNATQKNDNLAVAAARVKQARAIAGIASAARAPQVGVDLGAQRGRLAPLKAGLPPDAAVASQTSYRANLTASYEVDLFGRVSSSVAADRSGAAAAEASYRSVLLSLQADVAQHYFRLRAIDAELETVEHAVRLREENVRVNQRRFELGDLGEFDLSRARTELAITHADAIGLQRQRAGIEHALAVLLGEPASAFTADRMPLPESTLIPSIPAGLPSSLLERRPDIAAAQRAMEAANARIGVARAAMFPALNVNATGGAVGATAASLFAWNSRSWLLGALLSAPLVDGGRSKANVKYSEAALEESVAAYRQSALVAFAEVEDNLAGLRILAGQAEQMEEAVASAQRAADLAQKLYEAGRSSYLELLDAQRNLATVERNAVQLRGARAITTVALIRALGGGWGSA